MGFWDFLKKITGGEKPKAPEPKRHEAKPPETHKPAHKPEPRRDGPRDHKHGSRPEHKPGSRPGQDPRRHGQDRPPRKDSHDRPSRPGPRPERDSRPPRRDAPKRDFPAREVQPVYAPEPPKIPESGIASGAGFQAFNPDPKLVKAIGEMGFEKPTPVQERAVPAVLSGADLLVSAQTGSGKTVAFALPILQSLLAKPSEGKPSVLVLAPTRELAAQVALVFRDLGRHTGLRGTLICGGMDMESQRRQLKGGVDVVVATPGRLLDHLRHHTFNFNGLRHLVLDEADRMLDMGFAAELQEILHHLPRTRQTLLFSATLPPEVRQLGRLSLKDPAHIEIDRQGKPAEGITQRIYPVLLHQKQDLFVALLKAIPRTSTLVFTNTKAAADRLTRILTAQGITANALHADRTQSQRDATLKKFRDKTIDLVVATDVAARGLDIRHISHVINYDIAHFPEDYVHRIGRTARAFSVGEALTLVTPEEESRVIAIQRFIAQDIQRHALEGFPYLIPPKLEPPKPKTFADVFAHKRRRRTFKKR